MSVPAWRALHTDENIGFRSEGVAVDEKNKYCLADLSVPGAAVRSVCPVTAILDSGSGISTMSESVAAKLQTIVPDVQIVGPMTDDQYVKMTDGKLVLVKQKSCPEINSFIHNVGTGGDGSDLVLFFAGQGGRCGLAEPDSYDSGNQRA